MCRAFSAHNNFKPKKETIFMTKTTNYGLNQWEASDRVLRTDFNDDNAKIDAALGLLARVSTGSYVGTGTNGADHPNTLTFDFTPQVVIIVADRLYAGGAGTVLLRGQEYSAGMGVSYSNNSGLNLRVKWTENGVSWYVVGSGGIENDWQLNLNGVTYRYAAFG